MELPRGHELKNLVDRSLDLHNAFRLPQFTSSFCQWRCFSKNAFGRLYGCTSTFPGPLGRSIGYTLGMVYPVEPGPSRWTGYTLSVLEKKNQAIPTVDPATPCGPRLTPHRASERAVSLQVSRLGRHRAVEKTSSGRYGPCDRECGSRRFTGAVEVLRMQQKPDMNFEDQWHQFVQVGRCYWMMGLHSSQVIWGSSAIEPLKPVPRSCLFGRCVLLIGAQDTEGFEIP